MRSFTEYLSKRINNKNIETLLEFPSYVEIETVNACNARCPMCTINDWERNYPTMKDDVFNKISDELIEYKRYLERVSLYRDGEPLLDKKLPSKINKFTIGFSLTTIVNLLFFNSTDIFEKKLVS